MIASLKPHPFYKPSGVPWLGEVPATWKFTRNSGLFTQRNETGFGDLPILEVSLKTGVRVRDFDGNGRKQVMADRGKYKRARRGDLAYNMMRMWQGAVGLAPVDGLVSPAYVVARPFPAVEPRFFEYLFRTDTYMGEVDKFSHGIVKDRNRLYWEDFKQMPSPVPPPEEQVAIVRFLDHADRRIRRYIRAKQKLIKLLEEQKQAIIHRAVTRGPDPNVRLKPSGVAWLGNVPEHWEVSRLKVVLSRPVRNGLFKKKEAFGAGVPLVNVADVYRDNFRIEPSSLDRVQATPEEVRTYQVRPGDLFFVRSSLKLEGTGRSAIAIDCEPDTVFECHLVQGRPHPARANARFLAVQLNSFGLRHYLISRANVVTMATVAQDVIATCPVWLPSLSEQAKVLERLERENERLGGAIDRATREIDLLREYRIRLIADVVTGKLDVREAAARLPEEAQEPEPPDKADILSDAEDEPADERDAVPEEAEG